MTPHRSDHAAALARISALERELAAVRDPESHQRRPSSAAPVPRGFELSESTDRLRITWTLSAQPWPRAARTVLAIVAPIAIVFGIRQDQLALLCIAGIIAGLALLTGLGERAVLELSGGRLRVSGSSAAMPGQKPVPVGDIDQVYSLLRHDQSPARYELWAVMTGGQRVCLVRAIETAEAALYLKQALERRLEVTGHPASRELVGPAPWSVEEMR